MFNVLPNTKYKLLKISKSRPTFSEFGHSASQEAGARTGEGAQFLEEPRMDFLKAEKHKNAFFRLRPSKKVEPV